VLRLGSLCMVALSGEVVVDYALAIKRKYGGGTWVAAYTDSVFGYVPSAASCGRAATKAARR